MKKLNISYDKYSHSIIFVTEAGNTYKEQNKQDFLLNSILDVHPGYLLFRYCWWNKAIIQGRIKKGCMTWLEIIWFWKNLTPMYIKFCLIWIRSTKQIHGYGRESALSDGLADNNVYSHTSSPPHNKTHISFVS